nr:integrase, catalytic region, zinc finger, CCHC-type, peptidase aspartic, catalytic [Tanacetum cinerariifolium]
MSTQQDIYVAGSENRPAMLNKENYVPWSSRLLRYAKSRQNEKLIHNSIINCPYVRRTIPEPADDQAIQTILLCLPEDIYAAVDNCETAQEIWLRVQQMMKDSDIGIQEKKAKLFKEWERFTSTDGESIESYYHRFLKLMNDFKRNKHFLEKIASNLKAQLFDKVSEQKDTARGMSANTKFATKSILGKPPSSSKTKLYDVTPIPKSIVFPKVGETHALSKPVTSNSIPTPQESKVVKNDKVITPGMFMINPFKPSREEKYVPKKVKASVRTNPITILQPPIITNKVVNFDSNGLSSTGVDNTAKTRRPQPRSNTKNDRKFLGTVRFGNDHVATNLGIGDLQWGNILITKVYFVEGLGHNMLSVRQFCDLDLEVAFRRNTSFVRNLEGVDLLKGNRTANLYTINLHEMASASLICLTYCATSTKSWLWHQRLSHLNFDTIND